MANVSAAKNFLSLIAGKCTEISVTSSGSKRGADSPSSVPHNSIFVFTNGYVAVNNPSAPIINFILEGGSHEWEGAQIQENIFPYYAPAQMATIKILIDYCISLNKNLFVNSDLYI